MKFNEKLIELRRKQGLSQEELGHKLNVSRQTVSKWELGQTTPEMDKLLEISKMFNITVDELIREDDTIPNTNKDPIKDQPIMDRPIMNRIMDRPIMGGKIRSRRFGPILAIAAILIIGYMALQFFIGITVFNKVTDLVKGSDEEGSSFVSDIFDKIIDTTENAQDKQNTLGFNLFDKVSEKLYTHMESQLNEVYPKNTVINDGIDNFLNNIAMNLDNNEYNNVK